ncbi:hypothetical protein NC651_030242 [Populus alba x Populus x berolinensis]|nr:hypothetical protein NC651_030242 [Populus alba x Populus x berolinensis]
MATFERSAKLRVIVLCRSNPIDWIHEKCQKPQYLPSPFAGVFSCILCLAFGNKIASLSGGDEEGGCICEHQLLLCCWDGQVKKSLARKSDPETIGRTPWRF